MIDDPPASIVLRYSTQCRDVTSYYNIIIQAVMYNNGNTSNPTNFIVNKNLRHNIRMNECHFMYIESFGMFFKFIIAANHVAAMIL